MILLTVIAILIYAYLLTKLAEYISNKLQIDNNETAIIIAIIGCSVVTQILVWINL